MRSNEGEKMRENKEEKTTSYSHVWGSITIGTLGDQTD